MTETASHLAGYFAALADLPNRIEATNSAGEPVSPADAIAWAVEATKRAAADGGKTMFIGNGGSAGLASHMAIDFSKNGGYPALAFNDGASLTCLANDLGYENVFAHQVKSLGKAEDLLIAISSSGRSQNIIQAVEAAKTAGLAILTLSGFDGTNPLRELGDMNLYVPSGEYGFVEITHLSLCHAVLDLAMDWQPEASQ